MYLGYFTDLLLGSINVSQWNRLKNKIINNEKKIFSDYKASMTLSIYQLFAYAENASWQ